MFCYGFYLSPAAAAFLAGIGLAETGLAETGLAESGLAESDLAESGLAETGLAETGLAEPGLAETVPFTARLDEADFVLFLYLDLFFCPEDVAALLCTAAAMFRLASI